VPENRLVTKHQVATPPAGVVSGAGGHPHRLAGFSETGLLMEAAMMDRRETQLNALIWTRCRYCSLKAGRPIRQPFRGHDA
jgi:hypothetical protein